MLSTSVRDARYLVSFQGGVTGSEGYPVVAGLLANGRLGIIRSSAGGDVPFKFSESTFFESNIAPLNPGQSTFQPRQVFHINTPKLGDSFIATEAPFGVADLSNLQNAYVYSAPVGGLNELVGPLGSYGSIKPVYVEGRAYLLVTESSSSNGSIRLIRFDDSIGFIQALSIPVQAPYDSVFQFSANKYIIHAITDNGTSLQSFEFRTGVDSFDFRSFTFNVGQVSTL